MNFLLDTDICVYWLRGHPAVQHHISRVGPRNLAVSIVTVAELRYGAFWSERPDENNRAIDDFLSGIAVLGVDTAISRAFGSLKAKLRGNGTLIPDFDLLIGATARIYTLTLVTNNDSHFGRIEGLTVANWIES